MARLTQRFGLSRYEADEHYQLALEAYKKGRFDVAINHMDDAIAALPTRSEYYATRGFFYAEDDVNDKAQADFQKALKLHPYEMLAHYGRGMIAFKDKNWDEALAHFTDAYHSDMNRPETMYYLALVHHRKGNNPTALQFMQNALGIFEAANDRRKADAARWVKEFQKVIESKPQVRLNPPG
jgi:tetratricopeptide (TPR) repeat protein